MITPGEGSGIYVFVESVGLVKQATINHRNCLYQFISVVMIDCFHLPLKTLIGNSSFNEKHTMKTFPHLLFKTLIYNLSFNSRYTIEYTVKKVAVCPLSAFILSTAYQKNIQ